MSTSNIPEGMERAFYHASESWWWREGFIDDSCDDFIMVGVYDREGGLDFEFKIEFHNVGFKISIWDDALKTFDMFKDLFDSLKTRNHSLTPDEMCNLLIELGIKDYTNKEHKL